MKYKKSIGFVVFCFMAATFFACSDDFITASCSTEKVAYSKDLSRVQSFVVHKRYRDSVFLGNVGAWSSANAELIEAGYEDQIAFPKFNTPELDQQNADYLEIAEDYIKEFFMSWDAVDGASGYEIRVNKNPINTKNWFTSEKVMLVDVQTNDGVVKARGRITPTPKTYNSSCIDCGECYKMCPTGAITSVDKRAYIDYDKCVECGKCYQACDYNAIGGVFAGTAYYFAIRSYDKDSAFSHDINCTETRSKMRYTSLAEIPDSLLTADPESGIAIKLGVGCAGNCTDGSKGTSNGTAGKCHILQHNACPVDAIYEVASEDIERKNTTSGAMYIDFEKCINCGKCASACYKYGPWGAIVTEVVTVN